MNSALEIREAGIADLTDILRLYAQLGQDDGTTLSPKEAEELWREMIAHGDHRIWVAESEGKVVGTFSLLRMVNLAHLGAPSAVVEDVVVDESCRGLGIGKAMMGRAMEIAREKGCYKLTLSSNARRTDAHRFYETLGFRRHGISFFIETGEAHA